MPRRFVSALKDLLRGSEITVAPDVVPPPPHPNDPPSSWRAHKVHWGPYVRFHVHAPRDWTVRQTEGADLLHLEPAERGWVSGSWAAVTPSSSHRAVTRQDLAARDEARGISGVRPGADLAITLSWFHVEVAGPTGLVNALEQVLGGSIPAFEPSAVLVDRWGDDAWVGSWAWREPGPDGGRACRLVIFGHDEGVVTAMVHGSAKDVGQHEDLCESILETVRMSSAELLPPERFPPALCELLNERAAGVGEQLWDIDEQGRLSSGTLVVRMASIYRAYLRAGDLEAVAGLVDGTPRGWLERRWGGRSWEQVADHVRVVLRRADAVSEMNIASVPLPGGLVACPVLDTGDRMTFIPKSEMERWCVDARAMITRGVSVLDGGDPTLLVEQEDELTGQLSGVLIADEDGYDSGRLLCPLLRERLETALGGPLLVAMPSAWTIHVWRDTPVAREALADLARQGYRDEPTPLSESVWAWSALGLEPLE